MIARKRVQVFKPAIDDRYSDNEIVTHADISNALGAGQFSRRHSDQARLAHQVVGVDESNFFGPNLVEVANRLADGGKQVIIAGLDTDYMGRPFTPMPELLAVAESITKTLAICMRCGAPAKHTQRLVESNELILVGAEGAYEARCRRCFRGWHPEAGGASLCQAAPATRMKHRRLPARRKYRKRTKHEEQGRAAVSYSLPPCFLVRIQKYNGPQALV